MTKQKFITYFLAIFFLIILDQASKNFLISYLKTQPNYILEVLPILEFVYAWNYGISFGLFREYYQYSNAVFLVLNSAIILYLFYLTTESKGLLSHIGLVLIIGGAIGNLIDRVAHGAVFDFISLHYSGYYFPAFNAADSFITIGACFYIYNYLLCNKK